MTVAIIDYGSGNLHSAAKAFERAAREDGFDLPVVVTNKADVVAAASHIVLPGVGAFADCKAGLAAVDGMVAAMSEAVLQKGRPFIGICVGMQLMAERGLENGTHESFGWIKGSVAALAPDDKNLKIPHMGWNQLAFTKPGHPLFDGLVDGYHTYFIHSYAMNCENADHVLATTDYGGPVTAVIGRDNMIGTQFHPEKSQGFGLRLIANFLKWKP
ncbi:MAG: imidazole glycerol phosphate synthase subunit HisH [Rhodospirillaceae bacterium]|nr:imidazole glycerol phosphate synthase subunit HisH [Rhodospirillaceae bacterium]